MSITNLENSISTGTGLVSLVNTYLGPQGDAVAVFQTVQAEQPFFNFEDGVTESRTVTDFVQVFPNARPMKCTVRPTSKIMEHPLETGQLISDYKIILPVEITLPLVISSQYYKDTYAEINNLFATSELLFVQTRASVYNNMVITEIPDEERSDMFDVIMMELHLKQVLLVQAISNFAPADPTQADTQSSGQQSATPTTLPTNSTTNNQQVVSSWVGHVHDVPGDAF